MRFIIKMKEKKMVENNEGYRTISENAYKQIKDDPSLGKIIQRAIDDEKFCLEIRNEYINIYYRGG